uniref:Uncharacterized protein LOC111112483 n=1 Tax=Crassostrea virginica TaxID=6565 RepID=A0A8B8BQT3_CRAVI|nr:uncharacterized protein LOC111112483 [Crassostrea virginica]
MAFGEVNQLHTGSRGGDNYEKVNEETPVTKASMYHFSLNLRDDATNERSLVQVAVKIIAEVKQQCRDAIFGQLSFDIVNAAIRNNADTAAPPASIPIPGSLVRTANRIRHLERPQDPSDLHYELDKDFLNLHAPGFLSHDLQVGNRRHLIFYTDRQLQLLAKANIWYMDGTFRCINSPWKQLFSIHGFVKSGKRLKQIPLVFVIMSGKKKADYYEVLHFIDRRLPEDISRQ